MPVDIHILNERIAENPDLILELAEHAPWPGGHGDPEAHAEERRKLRAEKTALMGKMAANEDAIRERRGELGLKPADPEPDDEALRALNADRDALCQDQQALDDLLAELAAIPIGLDDQRAADIINRHRDELRGSYAELWFGPGTVVTAQQMSEAR